MRSRVRWLGALGVAGLAIILASACAAISGLDGYSEGDCHLGCDATADRALRLPNGSDALFESSTPSDTASPLGVDVSVSEQDAGDGASDATPDRNATPPSEGGCAAPDTIDNCSACGLACNTSSGTPSCDGATCTYSCNSNRQDCNRGTPPDLDGCECTGTACCDAGCQTIHNSGLSNPTSYYDCNPKANTTQTQAMAACTGTGGSNCSAASTTCGGIFGFGGTRTDAACGTVAGTCYCWVYSGQNAGEVQTADNRCNISCSSGPAWN